MEYEYWYDTLWVIKINLNNARQQMKEATIDYLKTAGSESVLQNSYNAGVGKTTITMELINDMELLYCYLTSKHREAIDNVAKPYSLLHLEGKNKLCQLKNKEFFQKANLFNSKYLCNVCPNFRVCEYQELLRYFINNPQSFSGVHHHFNVFNEFIDSHYEIVILDENFIDSMHFNIDLSIGEINATLQQIETMENLNRKHRIEQLLNSIKEYFYIGEFNIPKFFTKEENIHKFENIGNSYKSKLIDKYNENEKIYPDILSPILHYFSLGNNKSYKRYLTYDKRTIIRFQGYNFDNIKLTKMPFIILDATTPKEIYYNIMPTKNIRNITSNIYANTRTFQVISNNYSMNMLQHENIQKRLFNDVRKICLKHKNEKIFVSIRKKFVNNLKAYLYDLKNVNVAWYGGTRGENIYQECNVAILIGTPFPRPDVIEEKSDLLKSDKNIVEYMDCNNEMLQTIFRIRPLQKLKTHLYILSKIDTGFLTLNMNKVTLPELENHLKNIKV